MDAAPCEVVTSLLRACTAGSAERETLLDAVSAAGALLPCEWCREAQAAASRLYRLRLGKHERNILLHAPAADAPCGAILDPELRSHSDRETQLRAVRKLRRAGLLHVGERSIVVHTDGRRIDGGSVRRSYLHRTLRRTPLGDAVVALLRTELERGRPIRWRLHAAAASERARQPTRTLLSLFQQSLERSNDPAHKTSRQARTLAQHLRWALRLPP